MKRLAVWIGDILEAWTRWTSNGNSVTELHQVIILNCVNLLTYLIILILIQLSNYF